MKRGKYYQLSERVYAYAVSQADADRLKYGRREAADGRIEKPVPVTLKQIQRRPEHVKYITIYYSRACGMPCIGPYGGKNRQVDYVTLCSF